MGITMNLYLTLAFALLFLSSCAGTSSYYAENYVYSPGYKYWYPYGYRYDRWYGIGLEYCDRSGFHKHKYSGFHVHRQPNYKPHLRYHGSTFKGRGGTGFYFDARHSDNGRRHSGGDHRFGRRHKFESGLRFHRNRYFSGRHSIGYGHGIKGIR